MLRSRFSITPSTNTRYYYNGNHYDHNPNSSGRQGWQPPSWSTPLTDPANWEIRMEWETMYNVQGHIIGRRQVQRAFYRPPQAPQLALMPPSDSRWFGRKGNVVLLLVILAVPCLPVACLVLLLSLGVVLSLLGQLLVPLVLVALGVVVFWRAHRRRRSKRSATPKMSEGPDTWYNQPTYPAPRQNQHYSIIPSRWNQPF